MTTFININEFNYTSITPLTVACSGNNLQRNIDLPVHRINCEVICTHCVGWLLMVIEIDCQLM